MMPSRDWTAIRWADAPPAETARWIAVLPLAATEQHGPHLPVTTDVLIAEAYLAQPATVSPSAPKLQAAAARQWPYEDFLWALMNTKEFLFNH